MPLFRHVDLDVGSLERSLAFYGELLAPLGWTRVKEVEGERGEMIHYLSGEDGIASASLGLCEKQSDAHPVPYERYAVGIHHLAFDAGSRDLVDEGAAWLRERGVAIESGSEEYDYTPGIKLEIVHRPF